MTGATEVRFTVRLTPRGGADRVEGVEAGVLHARVAAAPADGLANASLVRLLADALGVPRSAVRIVSGTTGRTKTIGVSGIGRERIAERWPDLGV